MGKFTYETGVRVDFEDRLLAHLQIVIVSKLRRGEPFLFTWVDDVSLGNGRTAVWMHPAAGLTFKFYGSRRPAINTAWVDALAFTANTMHGLHTVPEPVGEAAELARSLGG